MPLISKPVPSKSIHIQNQSKNLQSKSLQNNNSTFTVGNPEAKTSGGAHMRLAVAKMSKKGLSSSKGNSRPANPGAPGSLKKNSKELGNSLRKADKVADVETRMLSNSTYFKTISDPFNFRGVQIPDLCMYPSVPFSVTDRRQLILDVNGNGYVIYGADGLQGSIPHGSLVPVTWVTGTTHNFSIGMMSNSNATTPINPTVNLFPTGGPVNANSPIFLQQWNTPGAGITNLFEKARLVSAGVAVDYTGNDFDNNGVITAAFAPRSSVVKDSLNGSIPVTVATIQNLPDAKVIPVNKNEGAVVLYRPQDFVSLDYTDVQTIYDDGSYSRIPDVVYYGEMYMIVTGGTPGKVLQVTTVLNYEGIPLFNTIDLFAVQTSKSDPLELSATFNALENVTPVSMGTDTVLGPAHPIGTMGQEVDEIEHNVDSPNESSGNSSFMDSIFSALSGVGGPIKEVMKIAEDVTPLVSAALSFV